MSSRQISLAELAAHSGVSFGTSGVRGLVVNLTPGLCAAYTMGFLSVAPSATRCLLIGHDLRPSSPDIARACHAGARALGWKTVSAGALPTPALAHAAQSLGLPAVMVTGSHIPFDRNGMKFYHPHGEITKADEQAILSSQAPADLHDLRAPEALPDVDPAPLALYLERYRKVFAPDALRGLRIGVYEHSSVARDLLHDLLRSLGAETIGLGRSDAFVAVDTEAVRAEDRANAAAWVRQHGLDTVVTTDGDADRPLVADEHGEWLRGDVLGILCARALGAGSVVTPVSSNTALELCGSFPEVLRTRIGSPYVIEAMARASRDPVAGFEANGGFLLGSDVTISGHTLSALRTRDAMLPILLVLAVANRGGGRLSALSAGLPSRYTFSDRLQNIDPAACRALLSGEADVAREFAMLPGLENAAVAAIDRTDGLRLSFSTGDILHLRPSGNAPELRCYAEAASPRRAEELCRQALARIAPRSG
ncbi:MAG: phosphomannomutase [Aestuariivirga sp.]|uniref:phosphomannomutase n=1 Tax=Aestuariivirga sp. TaxID=2650926 RepID=UPI0038D10E67